MAGARVSFDRIEVTERKGAEVDPSVRIPQFNISEDGYVLYVPPLRSLFHILLHKGHSVIMSLRFAFEPIPLSLVSAVTGGVAAWTYKSDVRAWQNSSKIAEFLWRLDEKSHLSQRFAKNHRVAFVAASSTAGGLLAFATLNQLILKGLLSYHGYMTEPKPSTTTKIWAVLLKYVFVRRPFTYTHSYRNSLPTLPIPPLEDTVKRLLESLEGVWKPEELKNLKEQSVSFLKNEGPKLHALLKVKQLLTKNYMADWWKKYVYLSDRGQLVVNSNYFGIAFEDYRSSTKQTAMLAAAAYEFISVRDALANGTFEPQVIGGTVPLCMDQYVRMFGTTRIPGPECDQSVTFDPSESRHIVVLHRGRFWRVECYSRNTGRLLSPYEIELQLISIVENKDPADEDEKLLPSLTAIGRTEWAHIRNDHFIHYKPNRASLDVIEKAMFHLAWDDEIDNKDGRDVCQSHLTGNGTNRWIDKSVTVVCDKNGNTGFHAEHSWGDGSTTGHIFEYVTAAMETRKYLDENGNIKMTPNDLKKQKNGTLKLYPPERLRFSITSELKTEIQKAYKQTTELINDVELCTKYYTKYDRETAKRGKCSPDAWVQMAMQLAYFRDQGHADQTYEAASTRMYQLGRTEAIRSASKESSLFVAAMEDPSKSKEERLAALRKACERHAQYSKMATIGYGCDRHLFGMIVVSFALGSVSTFLKNALSRPWTLSTSQVPARMLPKSYHLANLDYWKYRSSMAGFGPVAMDGYGVFYTVPDKLMFTFCVTARNSASNTSAARFIENIEKALDDMGDLVPPPPPKK